MAPTRINHAFYWSWSWLMRFRYCSHLNSWNNTTEGCSIMTNLKLSGNVSCGRIYVEEEDEPQEAGPKACSYNHCSEDSHTFCHFFSWGLDTGWRQSCFLCVENRRNTGLLGINVRHCKYRKHSKWIQVHYKSPLLANTIQKTSLSTKHFFFPLSCSKTHSSSSSFFFYFSVNIVRA